MDESDRSEPVVSADDWVVDVGFIINSGFCAGPDHASLTLDIMERDAIPLVPPALNVFRGHCVLSRDAADTPERLAKYYRQILDLAALYNIRVNEVGYLFWLRPVMAGSDDLSIDFPWYDTYSEAHRFFEAMQSTCIGQLYSDVDQSWELSVVADDKYLFIRHEDSDGTHLCTARFAKASFQKIAHEVLYRMDRLMLQLKRELGRDYFTERPKGGSDR